MTNCMAKTSRCSHCTPATEAENAANAAGTSADATSACDQSRKVLRGHPTPAATARALTRRAALHRRLERLRPLQARGGPHRAAAGQAAARRLKSQMVGPSNIFIDHL